MAGYQDITRVSFENVEDLYNENVKLAELRFSPTFINYGKSLDFENIILAVVKGIEEGIKKYNIEVGLICTLTREFDFEMNQQAVEDFIKVKNSHPLGNRLVGIDLAGQEKSMPPESFLKIMKFCRSNGLEVTIHSGEDTTSDHVKDTISKLAPKRIGHGIRIIDDENLVSDIIKNNIFLEVCPISN